MIEEKAKILIVDDEKINIDVLVGLLADGFKTVVAKNGEQALQRAHADPKPDLILLDIMMPGMNGFEVCQRLHADPATAGIPIIFITGKNTVEDETRGLAVGAVDFIRKPFNPSVVLARIHTHLSLQRQKSRLLELNELKNKFLGMAAHDLRNPLGAICSLSDLLLTVDPDEEERIQYTTVIRDVGTQMLNLINALLDVSVIESGHFNLDLRPSNLADLVDGRVQLLTGLATQKGIAINAELGETPLVALDRDRLAQVIDNLLSNAIKFSVPNSVITVRTGVEGRRVFCRVLDQGPGIPDAEKDRLFGAFQQLSARPTGKEKSTGLGLSIVKKIVEAHHGDITVANRRSKGAVFTVFLTMAEKSAQKGQGDQTLEQPTIKILLIEDDVATRFLYGKALASGGFQVVGEAVNGKVGLELFKKLQPDITLCDIQMPVMDGVQALKAMLEYQPDACILMLTSMSHPEIWEDCVLLGAKSYLSKETPVAEIQRNVRKVWEEHLNRHH